MKDMYKEEWLQEYLDENNTLIWSPEIILADVIMKLIKTLKETE